MLRNERQATRVPGLVIVLIVICLFWVIRLVVLVIPTQLHGILLWRGACHHTSGFAEDERADGGDDFFRIFHNVGSDFDVLAVGLQLDNRWAIHESVGGRVLAIEAVVGRLPQTGRSPNSSTVAANAFDLSAAELTLFVADCSTLLTLAAEQIAFRSPIRNHSFQKIADVIGCDTKLRHA